MAGIFVIGVEMKNLSEETRIEIDSRALYLTKKVPGLTLEGARELVLKLIQLLAEEGEI